MNVDEHLLEILAATSGRRLTAGDVAGRLGISPAVVQPAARRVVDDGLASLSLTLVHDIPTLHRLPPRPAARGA